MKFGPLIEQNTLYQMTPNSSLSDILFQAKFKFTLFDLEFDFENSVFHAGFIFKYV